MGNGWAGRGAATPRDPPSYYGFLRSLTNAPPPPSADREREKLWQRVQAAEEEARVLRIKLQMLSKLKVRGRSSKDGGRQGKGREEELV